MRVNNALLTLMAVWLWESEGDAASTTFKLCGRNLSETMSRVCQQYNSPIWDEIAADQPSSAPHRRRRQIGIAAECCIDGCSWEQLTYYCAISSNSEGTLDAIESHLIENRSAEAGGSVASPAAVAGGSAGEVGHGRSRGYGRAGAGARRGARAGGHRRRGPRCGCRGRRASRYLTTLMGNTVPVKSVERAAPVVGTVSPLLMWGRTLHADIAPLDSGRYAYVATYTQPGTD